MYMILISTFICKVGYITVSCLLFSIGGLQICNPVVDIVIIYEKIVTFNFVPFVSGIYDFNLIFQDSISLDN